MNKLVTGALGFIGSHYCTSPVYYIDNRSSNKINDINGIEIELKDENIDLEYVIHLAANANIQENVNYELLESNIAFTSFIFNKYKDSRILYASSAAIYHENNMYSISKAHNEWLAKKYNATGFRFFNVYGERDNGIVGKILHALKNDREITIYGGKQVRDFVSVEDVVRVLNDAADSKRDIIEVGTGSGTTIYDLIDLCQEVTGMKLNYIQKERKGNEQFLSICKNPISNPIDLKTGIKKLWSKILSL